METKIIDGINYLLNEITFTANLLPLSISPMVYLILEKVRSMVANHSLLLLSLVA